MEQVDICQIYVTGKVIAGPSLMGGFGGPSDPFMCTFEIAVSALSETSYFQVLVVGEKAEECAEKVRVGDQLAVNGWLKPEYGEDTGSREIRENWISGASVHYLPSGLPPGQDRNSVLGKITGQPEVPAP